MCSKRDHTKKSLKKLYQYKHIINLIGSGLTGRRSSQEDSNGNLYHLDIVGYTDQSKVERHHPCCHSTSTLKLSIKVEPASSQTEHSDSLKWNCWSVEFTRVCLDCITSSHLCCRKAAPCYSSCYYHNTDQITRGWTALWAGLRQVKEYVEYCWFYYFKSNTCAMLNK